MGRGQGQGAITYIEAASLQELRAMAEESAAALISFVAELGQDSCELDIYGLRTNGIEHGDWTVIVQRQGVRTIH